MKVAFDWKVQKNFHCGYREEKDIWYFISKMHSMAVLGVLSVTNTIPDE